MAVTFPTEDSELRWIIEDIRRDRNEHQLAWGEFALLYRKHEIGDTAESGFLTAGIPCRLANKRALAEDPVVCYVIAALRVIASPNDEVYKEGFLKVVLPKTLFDSAQAKAEEKKLALLPYLEQMVRDLPKEHEDVRKIWRSFYALRNLAALGVFKAVQYMRSRSFANHFRDFTTVDLETTDRDRAHAEIVEIAAVRVRDGKITDRFQSLVKPRIPIAEGALRKHRLDATTLASAPFFEDVWPGFREFCGSDVCVAHNGYRFDFPILRRMSEALPGADLVTYDTLGLAHELHAGGAGLEDLARVY